jgi:hypothetical protein
MRLLADLHISPQTVALLKSLGHDVVAANEILPISGADELVIEQARRDSQASDQQNSCEVIRFPVVAIHGMAFGKRSVSRCRSLFDSFGAKRFVLSF